MNIVEPQLSDYLRLAHLYEQALTRAIEPRGKVLVLPFNQAIKLLSATSTFNEGLPQPLLNVARKIKDHDTAIIEHFSYDENRQFFLNDLFDAIQQIAQERMPTHGSD